MRVFDFASDWLAVEHPVQDGYFESVSQMGAFPAACMRKLCPDDARAHPLQHVSLHLTITLTDRSLAGPFQPNNGGIRPRSSPVHRKTTKRGEDMSKTAGTKPMRKCKSVRRASSLAPRTHSSLGSPTSLRACQENTQYTYAQTYASAASSALHPHPTCE